MAMKASKVTTLGKVKTTAKKPEAKAANPPLAMKAAPEAMKTAKAVTPPKVMTGKKPTTVTLAMPLFHVLTINTFGAKPLDMEADIKWVKERLGKIIQRHRKMDETWEIIVRKVEPSDVEDPMYKEVWQLRQANLMLTETIRKRDEQLTDLLGRLGEVQEDNVWLNED